MGKEERERLEEFEEMGEREEDGFLVGWGKAVGEAVGEADEGRTCANVEGTES